MITLQLWRSACPDITDEEWPLLIDVFEAGTWTPAGARAALAAFRRGKVDAYDRVHAEREAEAPRRGWVACHCGARRLRIACEDCGHDRSVELLRRWGYPSDPRPPRSDGTAAAAALDRAWSGAKRDEAYGKQ